MELAVDVTTDSNRAFLSKLVSTYAGREKLGSKFWKLTTGWTFDSSWRTSRACKWSSQPGVPRELAREQQAEVEQREQARLSRRGQRRHDDTRLAGISMRDLTFSHSLCTSDSASCLHDMRLSIQPSTLGMVVGSVGGAGARSVGTRPTSSMFVSMLNASYRLKLAGVRGWVAKREGRGVRCRGRWLRWTEARQ